MGNARFVANHPEFQAHTGVNQRTELTQGQSPFAVILGCSDSRVPVEIIFDQGLGELFVIRVAGNVIGPTVIGSVEFAAAQLGTRLVVILGHSQCGAISSTYQELHKPTEDLSPSLRSIVERIRPSFDGLLDPGSEASEARVVKQATLENVRSSATQLRHGSAILENLIENEGLRIVGANYTLLNGLVEFFDGVPLE
jgi:carbonic anhydrase